MVSVYAKIHKVVSVSASLTFTRNYFAAPAGDVVFVILGLDRALYVPIGRDVGKEYAVRVVKGTAWNIT